MNITYVNPGFQAMIDSIMLFQTDGETSYWSDSIFYFFPKLNKDVFQTLDFNAKKKYFFNELNEIYHEQEALLNEKVEEYNNHWGKYRIQIEEALSDAFELDSHLLFNDLRAEICLNPVSPRFLKERYFQIFYLNSERGAIGVSIHEIIHFLWFHVWNQNFHDNYDEYERPSLKWILSEMVVECIMRDERLSSINPYFPRENGGCIYGYFQDMKLDHRMALDIIDEYYQCGNIRKFMHEESVKVFL
jgi:hypothetical protein